MTTVTGTISTGWGVPPSTGKQGYVRVQAVRLVTTAAGVTMLPAPVDHPTEPDGSWSLEVTPLPEGYAYEFRFVANSGAFLSQPLRRFVPQSGTVEFGDLVPVSGDTGGGLNPPTWYQDVVEARDETATAATEVASHAADVLAVAATNDGIMTSVAADENSAFATQLSATFVGKDAVYVRDYLPADVTTDPAANRAGYLAAYQAAAAGSRRLCYDGARFTMTGEPIISTANDMVHYATNRDLTKIIQATKGKPVLVVAGQRTRVSNLHPDGDNPTLAGIVGIGSSFRTVGIWVDPTAHDTVIQNVRVGGFFYGVRAHLIPWAELANATSDFSTVATEATYPTEAERPSLRNLTIDGLQSDGCWAPFHCVAVDGLVLTRITGKYLQAPGSTADPHLVYLNSVFNVDESIIYRWTKNVVWDDCLATSGTNRHAYRARGVDGMTVSNLRAVDTPGLLQFISVKRMQIGEGCYTTGDRLPDGDGSGAVSFMWCEGEVAPLQVYAADDIATSSGMNIADCENLTINRPLLVHAADIDQAATSSGGMLGFSGVNPGVRVIEPTIRSTAGSKMTGIGFAGGATSQALVIDPTIEGDFDYGVRISGAGPTVIYDPANITVTGQRVAVDGTSTVVVRAASRRGPALLNGLPDSRALMWHDGQPVQKDSTDVGQRWSSGQYRHPYTTAFAGDPETGTITFAGGSLALMAGLVGVADFDMRCLVRRGAATFAGIALRSVDTSNTLALAIRDDTTIHLRKRRSGTETTIATATVAFPIGMFAELRAVCVGNRIIGYLNGTQVIDYTLTAGDEADTFGPSMRAGLFASGTSYDGTAWRAPIVRSLT